MKPIENKYIIFNINHSMHRRIHNNPIVLKKVYFHPVYFFVSIQRCFQLLFFNGKFSSPSIFSIHFNELHAGYIFLALTNKYRTPFLQNCAQHELTIEINKSLRRNSIAICSIALIIKKIPNVLALVRVSNVPSQKLFNAIGTQIYSAEKYKSFFGSRYKLDQ